MTNSKQLLDHLSNTMEKLDKKRITVDEAKAQASLVKQSNNLLRYNLDVEKFKVKLKSEGVDVPDLQT